MIWFGSSERGLSDVIDHQIAQPRRDRAHEGAFAAIAIATAAKDGDTRPAASGRAVSSRFFNASSVCA